MVKPNDPDLRLKILSRWKEVKNASKNLNFFISRLETTSNNGIGIFGGAVRDWWLDKLPKDIDIVIDTPYFKDIMSAFHKPISNEFGGYVIQIDGVVFDIWNFEDSYAFKHGGFSPDWMNLVKSVPFNIDSIIVMTNYNAVYRTTAFYEGLENKTIEFMNPNHRDPKFIAQRALLFKQKYGFALSKAVQQHVKGYFSIEEDELDNVVLTKPKSSNSPPECDYILPTLPIF